MRKNIRTISVLFVAAFVVGLSSCAKKEGPATPFSRIIGNWKKAKYATDDNRNGVIDQKEIFLVESGTDNEIWFKSDSTGIETTNSDPALNFKWSVVDGASVLIKYSANDTVTYAIKNVSSVDLTLTTTSSLGLVWYYYIKH